MTLPVLVPRWVSFLAQGVLAKDGRFVSVENDFASFSPF